MSLENELAVFLSLPGVQAVGCALVHSLWQGAAVAAMLVLALVALRRRSAGSRLVPEGAYAPASRARTRFRVALCAFLGVTACRFPTAGRAFARRMARGGFAVDGELRLGLALRDAFSVALWRAAGAALELSSSMPNSSPRFSSASA